MKNVTGKPAKRDAGQQRHIFKVDMCLRMREQRSVLSEEDQQLADLYIVLW